MLSTHSAVREYLTGRPRLRQDIRELSAADVRVRDAGLMKSGFEDKLKAHTSTKVWLIDLAIAVLGVCSAEPGRWPPRICGRWTAACTALCVRRD